uniref:Uncharacterized protein n=1 Tax=Arion vulgaris TaxID=1028688 RepID=A0A0B6YTE5_9EUPU
MKLTQNSILEISSNHHALIRKQKAKKVYKPPYFEMLSPNTEVSSTAHRELVTAQLHSHEVSYN